MSGKTGETGYLFGETAVQIWAKHIHHLSDALFNSTVKAIKRPTYLGIQISQPTNTTFDLWSY